MKGKPYIERIKTISIETTPYDIHVVLSTDPQTARLMRVSTLGPYERDGSTQALHHPVADEPESYIFLKFEPDIGYVAHEAFHCVWRIMSFIGAMHENEIMAYYLGYIVRETCRFVAKTSDPSIKKNRKKLTSQSASQSPVS